MLCWAAFFLLAIPFSVGMARKNDMNFWEAMKINATKIFVIYLVGILLLAGVMWLIEQVG